MKVWIDVDNPPQVQYLSPFARAFAAAGHEVTVTARDYGATLDLLAAAGVHAVSFGTRVGSSKARKAAAVAIRAYHLRRLFAREGAPDVLLAASRSAAVAARTLGIPSFIVADYEHANVSAYRFTRSTFLHPSVVDPAAFTRRGIAPERVVAFEGIKEDITFATVDVDAAEPYPVPGDPGAVRVLFRPPSETSHYYDAASSALARAALAHLARGGAQVVLSPREPAQIRLLEGLPWAHEPHVLPRPVGFLSLLKAVDAVVCAGGTMFREAAYLGVPAYSIFRSETAAVDTWLQDIGRARLIEDEAGLKEIAIQRRGPISPLRSNPRLVDDVVALVTGPVTQNGCDHGGHVRALHADLQRPPAPG
jgi:uncharacterized protein